MISFQDLDTIFKVLPEEIDNLIFRMAYGKTRSLLHLLVTGAKSRNYYMPVPISWKLWCTDNVFDVKKYLEHPDMPIDVQGVYKTLEMLNWNVLKAKHNNLAKWAFFNTKTSIQRGLTYPTTRNNFIHMIWLILCSVNMTELTCRAHKDDNYKNHCMIPTFHRPLAAYYPIEREFFFFDPNYDSYIRDASARIMPVH